MAYENKPGEFALFKNDKEGNEKRPDYRGDGIDLEGNAIEVAAWIKQGKNGKFMSCRFKPKEAKRHPNERAGTLQHKGGGKVDEDVPFAPLRKVESSLL